MPNAGCNRLGCCAFMSVWPTMLPLIFTTTPRQTQRALWLPYSEGGRGPTSHLRNQAHDSTAAGPSDSRRPTRDWCVRLYGRARTSVYAYSLHNYMCMSVRGCVDVACARCLCEQIDGSNTFVGDWAHTLHTHDSLARILKARRLPDLASFVEQAVDESG